MSDDEPRPRDGDLVFFQYRYRDKEEGHKAGRCISRHTWGIRVDVPTMKRNCRVDWPDVKGWWPKGTPDRSFDNMRDPEPEES